MPSQKKVLSRAGLILAALGLSALFAGPALADCSTRHFYNESDKAMIVTLTGAGSCTIGASRMQRSCLTPPGGVAELHYSNSLASDIVGALGSAGSGKSYTPPDRSITVESGDGDPSFAPQSFDVDTNRCYIHHDQDTGILVINDPADGDLKVACRGQCASQLIDAARSAIDRVKKAQEKARQQNGQPPQ